MARQMGSRITALVMPETTYGTAPTGNWEQVPIISFDPGVSSDIVDDPSIGFGHREKLDPFRGPKIYKPKLTVPLDLRNLGRWLKLAFGNYGITGSTAPYTHTFKAVAASALPSCSIEIGYPDANTGAGLFMDYSGCVIDTLDFDLQPTGTPKLVIGMVAQTETENKSTSLGGTPTVRAYTPFSQIQGTFNIDSTGSPAPANVFGNVTGATLKMSNNVDAPSGAVNGGLIIGGDAGQLMVTGDVSARLDATTLLDLATNAGFGALSFGYNIGTGQLLKLVMPRVSYAKPSIGPNGPGGIDAKYSWQASRDATLNYSVAMQLTNDVASY